MDALTLSNITVLDDNVTINSSTLSPNQTSGSNDSQVFPDYRMYLLPPLPEWVSTLYLVLLCLTIGLGIPGNLITALAYFFVKTKTSCDWYIFFVAFYDLISCTFRVTGYLLEFLDVWVKLTNDSYCLFVAWLSQTSVCVSIFIFGLISVERCIRICCATSYKVTAERSKNICLIMSAIMFVMGFPTVFMYTNTSNGVCSVPASNTQKTWVKAYYCIIIALFIALTIAAIVCYAAIIWTVRKRRKAVGVFPDRNMTYNLSSMRPLDRSSMPGKTDDSKTVSAVGGTYPSEAVSTTYAGQTQGPCNNIDGCPSVPLRPVQKLFVVTGPRTKVIIQQDFNMATRNQHSSSTSKQQQQQQQRLDDEIPGLNANRRISSDESGMTMENGHTNNKWTLSQPSPPTPPPPLPARPQPEPPTETTGDFPPLQQPSAVSGHGQALNMFSQYQYARRQRRDFKITGLLFLVTSVFIVSWIPPYYATVKAFFIGYTFPISTGELITLKLAPTSFMINNFSNPIIYLALSSTYRQKVRYLWTKLVRFLKRPCCCQP